jgi:hypothetical protein
MLLRALLVASLSLTFVPNLPAHDIPNDLTIHAFLKPEGSRLHLVMRVPLKAAGDVQFPVIGAGYLDLSRSEARLREAALVSVAPSIEVYENGLRLFQPRIVAVQASLESDTSFHSYEEAVAHVTGPPLPKDTKVYSEQAMLDVLLEYPIQSASSQFSIHPAVGRLGLHVVTAFQFLPRAGVVRAFDFVDDPGLIVLDPSWHQATVHFIKLGFLHILSGRDHLLFLICLVIPFRRFRTLIPVVTSFTLAHSITLIASAYNFAPHVLWFAPLIETLIAMSILYMALENIAGTNVQRRWVITFAFGLVHGFGFSFALGQTLQFAGSHLLTSLLSFNIGVELGQILVLVLLIPALDLLFRFAVAERMGTIIISALVAHTGWHWLIERSGQLRQFQFVWPTLTLPLVVSAMRWLMLGMISFGLLWLGSRIVRYFFWRRSDCDAASSLSGVTLSGSTRTIK